jgi:hypothetical protein
VTKLRPALCHTRALMTVVNRLSWTRVARISRRAERTVRKWSEPDLRASIPLETALKLDIEFIASGHIDEVAPFESWYRTRLQIARAAARDDATAPVECVAVAAREGGEAIAAHLIALQPSATLRERRIAQQETEEAIAAFAATLRVSIEAQI